MNSKKLSPKELLEYKQILTYLRARMRNEVVEMSDSALHKSVNGLSSVPQHLADLGTDNYEQEFTLTLVQNSSEVLNKIELALERLEEGNYGKCEECGCWIPKARLTAIPYAALCVKCAEDMEKGYF